MARLNPNCENIWQRPLKSVRWDDEVWFEAGPLSKNKIGGLMSTLSTEAKLSKTYTNHCVHRTVIGIETHDIMTVSGHKKVETIQNYSAKTPNTKKRAMSNALTTAIYPEKVMKKENNAPASKQNDSNSGQFDLSMRDLLELSPEEEKEVMDQLLNDDMVVNIPQNSAPTPPVESVNNNNNNSISNAIQNKFVSDFTPRMAFANSNITINFNFK